MLINKKTKAYQTRSDMPASNWLDTNYSAVPDDSELAQKIIRLFPHFNLVFDDNGEVIDVVEIQKTQEEIKTERKVEIKAELETLDVTINRATEDLYSLTSTTPYEKVAEVIQQKEALRQELATL